jgi:uncharacterized surface protein with fasciclin (FAS1) repeats
MKLKTAAAGSIAALIFLAGCSSDGDDAATETTSAAPAASETAEAPAELGTIVDVAASNPDFSTLVAAVDAAGLVDTLSGPGPFTVFAPTNDAFDALPEGLLDALLLPENSEALTKILTYHVVAGEVTSDMITPGAVETVEGDTIDITTEDAGVQVDGANVISADVDTSNGVIHVIDAVLVPADVDPAALLG